MHYQFSSYLFKYNRNLQLLRNTANMHVFYLSIRRVSPRKAKFLRFCPYSYLLPVLFFKIRISHCLRDYSSQNKQQSTAIYIRKKTTSNRFAFRVYVFLVSTWHGKRTLPLILFKYSIIIMTEIN